MNTLEYLLKLQDGAFTGPLQQATGGVGRFNQSLAGVGRHTGAVGSLGGAFTNLAAKIGAAFTAYKALEVAFGGVSKSLGLASAAETTATAFKTILGSAAAAESVLSKIKKLSTETPFEFPELANAGKMLLAFGEAAADIPSTLRRIGDISSGVAAPIGDIAEIYGKARTQNQLFAEDINQLTGRGIPIIRAFAQILKQPESAVKKLAEEGKITFPLLDQAFRNLTSSGGQFFGMMAEQSKTSAGLWSTLKDSVNELFLEFGKPLNDAIKPILTDAIGLAGQLVPLMQKMGGHMAEALAAVRNFVMEAESGGGVVTELGKKLKEAFAVAGEVLMIPIHAAMAAMPSLGMALLNVITPAVDWLDAKLEEGALKFGRVLMQQMSEVMAKVPFMGDAAAELNRSANASGKQGNLAGSRAEDITKSMPDFLKEAGNQLAGAMEDFNTTLRERLEKVVTGLPEGFAMGQVPTFKSHGMVDLGKDDSNAPGAKEATEAATKAKEKTASKAKAAAAAKSAPSFLPPPVKEAVAGIAPATAKAQEAKTSGAVEKTGRKKIAGFSYAKSGANAGFGGLDEFYRLQEKRETSMTDPALPGYKRGGYVPVNPAFKDGAFKMPKAVAEAMTPAEGGPAGGAAAGMKKRYMGGGLDEFHARNKTTGLKPAFTPQVASPGTAKRSQERREAAATAARTTGTHPLAATIKAIEAKLNTLAVA